ncbi:MAG: hypothetical protein ACK5OX_14970 [Desertimonas sp.]
MANVLIALGIVVVAVIVAAVVRRRRPDAPTQPAGVVPAQLDRADFERPEAPWLVAVFSSATCRTCADVGAKAAVLASDEVAVSEAEFGSARAVHERYGIDAVPLVVVADAEGVVRRHFLGPVTATDLWAGVAAARSGDDTPSACHGHD